MRQAGEVTYTNCHQVQQSFGFHINVTKLCRIEVEKEWLSLGAGATWSTRWTSWMELNWVAGGSGSMRKARAGEGPGPDLGKTLFLSLR